MGHKPICASVLALALVAISGLQYNNAVAQEIPKGALEKEVVPDKGETFKGSTWMMVASPGKGKKDDQGFLYFATHDAKKGDVVVAWKLNEMTGVGKGKYENGLMTLTLINTDKKQFNVELSPTRDEKDRPHSIGFGRWKDKDGGDEDWKQFMLICRPLKDDREGKDRIPHAALAKALTEKKWVTVGSSDGKEYAITWDAPDKTLLKGKVGTVEVKGTLQGTMAALTWVHDPDDGTLNRNSFLTFYQKDGKWKAIGFRLGKDDKTVRETLVFSEKE